MQTYHSEEILLLIKFSLHNSSTTYAFHMKNVTIHMQKIPWFELMGLKEVQKIELTNEKVLAD